MKAELWALFGFTMVVVMTLSAGFIAVNEINMIIGSEGNYLNTDVRIAAYRIYVASTIGLCISVANIMAAGKK